jgi:predicted nucleic acid-binding Zn ribbon protein
MPTYDYVCDGCGHAFELFLRRLIGSGGAIVFKGSGFYKTDYRSESYKKGAAADSGGGKTDSGKKSDSGGSAAKASGGD